MSDALLVLEDGRSFCGRRFGAAVDTAGEVVFNTCMSGYQEILTDPSYAGQIVVMTYPMIGNYGIAAADAESRRVFAAGLVVKEVSRIASNWRHSQSLPDYLTAAGVPGLCGFDTRALVRHLRNRGAMRGAIGSAELGVETLQARARGQRSMQGADLAGEVSAEASYGWSEPSVALDPQPDPPPPPAEGLHVVAYDFGVKRNILRRLVDCGCKVTVVPAKTSAADALALHPDGVLLSNGPGDPEPVEYGIHTVRELIGKVPIFGICLGHQLLALAAGATTYKLKFGHRGGNHPVMDLATHKVQITSHNHGFAVDPDSLDPEVVELTHIDLNDQTVEGLRLRHAPAFSVQYHPEAAPGPHDAAALFDRFVSLMRDWKEGADAASG